MAMAMRQAWFSTLLVSLLLPVALWSQRPSSAQFEDPTTGVWFNSYNNFRLSEKLFYVAQLHLRPVNTENTPFVGQMGQIYNRHGINYLFSKRFNVTAGFVWRFDFSNTDLADGLDRERVVSEPRIWHEYLFVMPFERLMLYHRLRIEHRWSRNHLVNSDYIFRNRWRYMLYAKIPLNKPTLSPGTWYANPEIELIMQSGPPVIDATMEDLRLFPSVGYIMSPRLQFRAGIMYTTGQKLSDGSQYRQRWILRFHSYLSLDFRKFEKRLPDVRTLD